MKGSSVNAKDMSDSTALHISLTNGNPEMDYLPLDNGTQLNGEEESVAKIIINNGGDVNTKDKHGNTPLHYAVKMGNLEMTKLIIDHGGDVNAMKTYGAGGQTPLHLAVLNGDTDIVNLLLMKGASVNAKDMSGSTALHISLTNGNPEMDYLPLDNGTQLNGEQESVAKIIINNGGDVNTKDKHGNTPLHYAVKRGNLEIAKLIIDHGGDVNARNAYRSVRITPLYYALKRDNCEIAELLLMNKANLKKGCEALFIVLKNGFIQFLQLLLKFTRETDTKISDDTNTPLISDAANNIKNFITLLVENGANVNAKKLHGITPLHYAADMGCEELVRHFLDYGAIIHARNYFDETKLWYVFDEGIEGVRSVLLENNHRGTAHPFSSNEVKAMERAKVAENEYLHLAAQQYNLQIVKILLEYGADVNARSRSRMRPIHYSARRGSAVISQLLLDNGADVNANDEDGMTALHRAAYTGFIHDQRSKEPGRPWVKNRVHIDAEKCYLALVKILLKNGADVNAKDKSGSTVLHISLQHENPKMNPFLQLNGDEDSIAKIIMTQGGDVNAKDKHGNTPLHYAVERGNFEITKLLLLNKANLNEVPEPLLSVIKSSFLQFVKLILKYTAESDTNISDDIVTCLISIEANYITKFITFLKENGANVNAEDWCWITSLHYAVDMGCEEFVKFCLKYRTVIKSRKPFVENRLPYVPDYEFERHDILKWLARKCEEPFTNDEVKAMEGSKVGENTSLHLAAQQYNLQVVKLLLEYRADVDAISRFRKVTPIHYCVQRGSAVITQLLLDSGAEVNAEDQYGRTALHKAAEGGFLNDPISKKVTASFKNKLPFDAEKFYVELVRILLKNGADVNSKDNRGETPIHYSSQNGNFQILKILLEYGADVNTSIDLMEPPIHYSAQRGSAEITQLLKDNGADINAKDRNGRTLLHKAAEAGLLNGPISKKVTARRRGKNNDAEKCYAELVRILLQNSADVNSKANEGEKPIHFAAQNGNLENGADDFWTYWTNGTPLHYSARKGNGVITQLLLDSGADVNAKDKDGRTALHEAAEAEFQIMGRLEKLIVRERCKKELHIDAEKCYAEVVVILLKNGADVNSKDNNGQIPIHFSVQNCNYLITKLLLNNGSDIDTIEDRYGHSTLNVAIACKFLPIVKLLLQYWANPNSQFISKKSMQTEGNVISTLLDYGFLLDEYWENLDNICKVMLKRHLVKLSAAGVMAPVYSRSTAVDDFLEKCQQEIKYMKREMINSKISFYEVLVMQRNKLAKYLRYDRSYEAIFGPKDYKTTFPIYAGMIETSVRKQKLFQICWQALSSLTNLPISCTEKICSYISECDLRNIIIVCKLAGKAFGN